MDILIAAHDFLFMTVYKTTLPDVVLAFKLLVFI